MAKDNGNGTGEETALVERESKQPRFKDEQKSYMDFVATTVNWVYRAHLTEPTLTLDTREYDSYLYVMSQYEPHLAGILNSVTGKDKNRGWSLTGGVRQVARITDRLRNVEDGKGWRHFMSKQSLSYYTSNLGTVTELEHTITDNGGQTLMSMYHVDPTRCRVTGKNETPLQYFPAKRAKSQQWRKDEFFRTVSMPDIREEWFDVGFCAVNRCLSLAKMMVAIYEHDLEMLGANPPKGFVVGTNVNQKMYDQAKEARKLARENGESDFDIIALFGSGAGAATDVKFVPFSQLPTNFDIESWTHMLIYGYSLDFGYDPQEFYPVKSGAFGRQQEATIQSEKAAGKGELDFILGFQDNLQGELPDTVDFQFKRSDPRVELQAVEVKSAKAKLYKGIYESPGQEGGIDRDEYRIMLAESEIIPSEWTVYEETTESTDLRTIARDTMNVRRAAALFSSEPIVRYDSHTNRVTVLYDTGDELLRRRAYPVAKPTRRGVNHAGNCSCSQCRDGEGDYKGAGKRRRSILREAQPGDPIYESDDGEVVITTGDVDKAIEEAAEADDMLEDLLNATVVNRADYEWVKTAKRYRDIETGKFVRREKVRALLAISMDETASNTDSLAKMYKNGELSAADWKAAMKEDIKREYIRQYLAGRGGRNAMSKVDWSSIGGMLSEQYKYLNGFADAIETGDLTEGQIAMRARMYISSAREAYERANARAYGVKLPFYPGDGSTQCLTNCKCYWDIIEVRDAEDNITGVNCYWRRTAAESCEGCIERSNEYNPLYFAA